MSFFLRAEAAETNIPAPAPSPQQVVAHTLAELQAALSPAKEKLGNDPTELLRALDHVISHNVDIPHVARLSLGHHWLDATDTQKKQLVALLHQFMLRLVTVMHSTSSSINGDGITNITFLPARLNDIDGDHAIIRTVVSSKGGRETSVSYHLCTNRGGWRIYDVFLGGVSLRPLRASIYSVVRQHGIDGLVARLEEKVNVRAAD